ncbi:ComEC/Rec2 family competence protein [Chachezhania antarctica]|uniref:ComEC/Rec2 family competence protein n=1 Tax=Chachezhania antarctica TaxID=2340860 RepID=UPI000EADDCC5|nr:ComEC/Rec2 family competence protein [Chachezhania antarctica]
MGAIRGIDAIIQGQRGGLFCWVPVFMGTGIGVYFLLRAEPSGLAYGVVASAGAMAAIVAVRAQHTPYGGGWSAVFWALALVAFGFCLAGYRAHSVAAPVLKYRYYGPVEGRVVAIDRSSSDAVRITLDAVRLARIPPDRQPPRVRVSLHGPPADLQPGQRVMTTAFLSPPGGPVEPGGYDFRRQAWFDRLGAVGYTRVAVLTVAPAEVTRGGLWIYALRMRLSTAVQQALGGDVGGVAAAITTGDRSGIDRPTIDALRASNLAHLLAISGLHMGLLAGFVLGALRLGLSAIPWVALRWPTRKIAAAGALIAGAVYLALSGGSVATERAFVMVAVMLVAVLFDRRAISLRAVALAAVVVMVLRPESLLGPGFQMSFAATTALVAVFGTLRDRGITLAGHPLKAALALVTSSAVAGAATAPVAAAHFNAIAVYGLAANLLSVPVMGTLVMPAAVLAAVLTPVGLGWLGLELMGLGLRWILFVAHTVADLDGARRYVMSPPWQVLPLIAAGMLFLFLWKGRARLAGLAPVALAFVLWAGTERPSVLVADTGGLVGAMTPQGRALSRERGSGFVARVWLENDGDGADQWQAAQRWPGTGGRVQKLQAGGKEILHVIGKRGAAEVTGCVAGQILIASVPLDVTGPCEIYDTRRLTRTGSLSIGPDGVVSAMDRVGDRLWTPKPRNAARRLASGD